jgi:hypothetical protein
MLLSLESPHFSMRNDAFDEARVALDRVGHVVIDSLNTLDQMFARIYAAKQCFAPQVPCGSSVLFERDIVHGSYPHSRMTVPRFSLDFRVMGIYRRSCSAKYEGASARGESPARGKGR